MLRSYLLPFAAVIFASCSEKKPINDLFAWQPAPDSIYNFSVDMMDWTMLKGDTNYAKKTIKFSLQQSGETVRDSLRHMTMVIKEVTITQRAIKLGTGNKGSIMVLPAGSMITLSTDDTIAAKNIDEPNQAIYGEQLKILSRLKGDSLQLTINHRGEVTNTGGVEEIFDRIAAETGFDRRTVNGILYDHVSSPAINDLFDRLFFYLPGRKIQQGDNWVKDKVLVTKAPVKYSHLIRAALVQDNIVQLALTSVVSDKLAEDGVQHVEGEMSGTIYANYDSGLPLKGEMTENTVIHADHYDVVKKYTTVITRY